MAGGRVQGCKRWVKEWVKEWAERWVGGWGLSSRLEWVVGG
jgi:hypothetical protein